MMTDYYLKFFDEEDANMVINPLIPTHSIDVIGTIFKPDPVDPTLLNPVDGWHVNVRGPEVPGLSGRAVKVKTPSRTWM